MVYNFKPNSSASKLKFYWLLIFIWGWILINTIFIVRYQDIYNHSSDYKRLIAHQAKNINENAIQFVLLNRFLTQFSSWVPMALRVQKIEFTPNMIRVYGHVHDEKIFSILWENFKNQEWMHQLKLLKWELQSVSKWIFAFEVKV